MAHRRKPAKPLLAIFYFVCAGVAFLLCKYAGPPFWLSAALFIFLAVFLNKTHLGPKFFRLTISGTSAHMFYFIFASAMLETWQATPDIILLLIGIIWLWMRPGFAASLYLLLVQTFTLAIFAVNAYLTPYGEDALVILAGIGIIKFVALTCLVFDYSRMLKERAKILAENTSMPAQ